MTRNKQISIFIVLVITGYGLYQLLHTTKPIQIKPIQPTQLTVTPPQFLFKDISNSSGLDFVQNNSATGEKLLPETMGTGVAAVDIDNDGDEDLIFVSATRWPWQDAAQQSPAVVIYLNDGSGKFKQKSYSGIKDSFYAVGIAVADIDANGFKDLFITAVGRNYLYLNNGKEFNEVATARGVSGDTDSWSTGATFFDYDNDGDLDLFYGNYVKWDKQLDIAVNYTLTGIGKAYGPPTDFSATSLKLLQNNGDGYFLDVSIAAGIATGMATAGNNQKNPTTMLQGKSLVLQPLDFDEDGAIDLFVANDTTQNFLFHNMGNGTFKEQGELLGVAYDSAGHATGAMGVDVGYFGENNEQVIAVGNFANEMTSYFIREPKLNIFSELSIVSGIGPKSRKSLTFGVLFVDLDNDGREDLFQVNGHVENEINQVQKSQFYRQPPQLFWNCGNKCASRFIATTTFSDNLLVARGVAYADIDHDGDVDIVITQVGDSAVLLRNDTPMQGKWLRIELHQSDANADAIGAMVTLITTKQLSQDTTNGSQNSQEKTAKKKLVMPTRGYLSQSETALTFHIPEDEKQVEFNILWPDGSQSTHQVADFNKTMVISKPIK